MELRESRHAVSKLGVHLVWCTKYRHDVLVGAVEISCKRLIAETCRAYEWKMPMIEVMPDHVHVYIEHDHMTSVGNIAKTLKSISAATLFAEFATLKKHKFWGSGLWSRSTYYGSVGQTDEKTVKTYIRNQKRPKPRKR